jgi:hypothetical protein
MWPYQTSIGAFPVSFKVFFTSSYKAQQIQLHVRSDSIAMASQRNAARIKSESSSVSMMSASTASEVLSPRTRSHDNSRPSSALRRMNAILGILACVWITLLITITTLNSGNGQRESISQILQSTKSDKFWRHHYEWYYDKWLAPYRDVKDIKILEIGARHGNSLKTWSRYFSSPKLILGLAYGKSSEGVEDNVQGLLRTGLEIMRGDQSQIETLVRIQQRGMFDVIIDDGSHVPSHMTFTLFHLWPAVKPGGMYVVEDLETNYWPEGDRTYNYKMIETGIGASPNASAVEKIKQLIDVLGRNQIGAKNLTVMPGDDQICSINWGRNLVAINKCTKEEQTRQAVFQHKRFDDTRMDAWLEKARASNPKGFQQRGQS